MLSFIRQQLSYTNRIAILALGLFGLFIGCGNSGVDSPAVLSVETLPLQVTRDVGDNLVAHFSAPAGKPPVNRVSAPYQFDFLETARTFTPDGGGLISGTFLFSLPNQPVRRGTIDIFYLPEGNIWRRTGQIRVQETDVSSVTLITQVINNRTGEPVDRVAVIARREDGIRSSGRILTDDKGRATLEVLSGNFQISADHPGFVAITTPVVSAIQPQLLLDNIRLTPVVQDVFRTPVKSSGPRGI